MEIRPALNARIEKWKLLKHPFYQSWEAGELPMPALQSYAKEYGAFISLMPEGWETLNDAHTVEEEKEHIELWQDFASAIETEIGNAELPAIKALVAKTHTLFSEKSSALGALYAFEVQQPETASSKLDGLREHYDVPVKAEAYFVEHSKNQHESEKLLVQISALSDEEQAVAMEACEDMSMALWDALTDIYDTHCVH